MKTDDMCVRINYNTRGQRNEREASVASQSAEAIRKEYDRLKASQSRLGYTAFVASVRVIDRIAEMARQSNR